MKTHISNIYGECLEPESFNELTNLLLEKDISNNKESYEFVPVKLWRGQGSIEWRIDSSAFRRIQHGSLIYKDGNKDLRSYEKYLLKHATHKGFRYQDGRVLNDFELLAKLQHHGAATRLVDFSRNAFIGLWFCISSQIKLTGILIGIHTHYIGGGETTVINDSYDKEIDSAETIKHPLVFEPPTLSTRIAAQHAQFLYSGVSEAKTGSLFLPEEEKSKLFIAITPKLKKESKEILEAVFDFRTKTLFPDLDGFGMANNFNINPRDMDRW